MSKFSLNILVVWAVFDLVSSGGINLVQIHPKFTSEDTDVLYQEPHQRLIGHIRTGSFLFSYQLTGIVLSFFVYFFASLFLGFLLLYFLIPCFMK